MRELKFFGVTMQFSLKISEDLKKGHHFETASDFYFYKNFNEGFCSKRPCVFPPKLIDSVLKMPMPHQNFARPHRWDTRSTLRTIVLKLIFSMRDHFYFYKISRMLSASFYNINQFKTEKQDIIENFFSILQLGVLYTIKHKKFKIECFFKSSRLKDMKHQTRVSLLLELVSDAYLTAEC